jgi:hypothetical protein
MPPRYSASVNCQPISTHRTSPSSHTRLVEANWKASAEAAEARVTPYARDALAQLRGHVGVGFADHEARDRLGPQLEVQARPRTHLEAAPGRRGEHFPPAVLSPASSEADMKRSYDRAARRPHVAS